MKCKSTLIGLFGGFILPLLLQTNIGSQIAVKGKVHCDNHSFYTYAANVHCEESTDEEIHIAGYGSCPYCGCPAFTESYNDSYRCVCGHSWDDHFSSGA